MIRPEIIIQVYQGKQEIVDEVLAGIEEEGVLYHVREVLDAQSAAVLAVEGAQMSQLEVGIGINQEEVFLTVQGLQGERLLQAQCAYRQLGQNAARYVKGNSFTQMVGGAV
ncbi:MAG: glycerol dehydratase reactivase beta/small subunit family protein [Cellulosilyticaceae bacterium]